MAKALVSALALASVPSSLAFQNTSPLFFFSTAALKPQDADIATAEHARDGLRDVLADCPTKAYFIVAHEGVSTSDYQRTTTPNLASYMNFDHADIRSAATTSEIVGKADWDSLSKQLQGGCGAERVRINVADESMSEAEIKGMDKPVVVEIKFPAHDAGERLHYMQEYDNLLDHYLQKYAPHASYSVIYTTTPRDETTLREPHTYEMETPFKDAVHMEMKRDSGLHRRADQEGGLFEKYQYFSPGLFMAFAAMVPLIIILGVGLNALASLEVSYFAFSKEMGPAGQKKQ